MESKKNSIEAGKTCDMKSGGGCNKLLLQLERDGVKIDHPLPTTLCILLPGS